VEICRFGELHPVLTECLELKTRLYILEMNLTRLAPHVQKEILYRPIPKYPSITRDLAIVLDESVSCQDAEEVIRKTAGLNLESLSLFDLYRGDPVPEDKKSLAYNLVFRATDRTLTDQEVSVILETILNELKQKYGAALR
jgi:phenylalanyl-tRNA synthetase beta chain